MQEDADIRIDVEPVVNGMVVKPTGEIDLSRSPVLRERLREALDQSPLRLIINLENVPYMDSSGVATLVEALQIARRTSVNLVLCNLQEKVRSVFEIARLDTVFSIAPTQALALDE